MGATRRVGSLPLGPPAPTGVASAGSAATMAYMGVSLLLKPPTATYVNGATTTGNSATVTVPAPSPITAGNFLLAVIFSLIPGQTTNQPITAAPAGWTAYDADTSCLAGDYGIYWKQATASEPASYSWTLAAATQMAGAILQYAGPNGAFDGEAVDFAHFTTSPPPASAIEAPSLTPSVHGDLWVVAIGMAPASGVTTPAGMTPRVSTTAYEYLYTYDKQLT